MKTVLALAVLLSPLGSSAYGPAKINQGSYQGPPTTQSSTYTGPPYHFGPAKINQNRAAKPKLSAMADYNDKGEQGG